MGKRIAKWSLLSLLVLALLVTAFFTALRFPTFQTFLAQRATDILSSKLDTKVYIDKVKIQFFNQADFVGFYLEDLNQDTLIYAGDLHLKFKVFDLLKKNITISSITLNRAQVRLFRDSTGEHLNLTDVFKKLQNPEAVKKDTTTSAPFAWKIDLDQVQLSQTDFRYRDEKAHTNITVWVPTCDIATKDFDLKNNRIAFRSIRIDGVNVGIELAKREKRTDEDTTGEFHFLPKGPLITFDEFALTNARFHMTDHNSDTILPKGMDFKHLDISGINLLAEKGAVVTDTIFASVTKLTAMDRSGFAVKNLSTEARVSVNDITLKNLDIKTRDSHITNYLSFRYDHFRDFKDFLNKVTITANLRKSELSLKDLNYFVRNLEKVQHNKLAISGEVSGKVNNLRGKNLEVRTATASIFKGDFFTKGLPNIYETSLNLRVERLATTANDLKRIYPAIKFPPNLERLGVIHYSGSLDGFVTDFVSNGKAKTDIGSATTDINFKYDKKRNKSSYSGNLALNDFDLGKYFGDEKDLGTISMNTQIKGGGLTLESLHADLVGNISSMTLKGYEYKDIKINGSVVQKSFNGKLSVRDQYLDMDFDGKVDLTQKIPEFDFSAGIHKAILQKLNLTKTNFSFAANVNSNFRGSNLEDLVGTIRIANAQFVRDSIVAYINYLTLDADFIEGGQKKLKLSSEVADGELVGHFSVKELPEALINFAKYTFTRNFVDTSHLAPQDFTVDVRIYDPRNLTRIIVPSFTHIENTRLTGEFSSINHRLHLTAYSPDFQIGNLHFREANIDADAENTALDFTATLAKLYNGDSLMIDTAAFTAKTQENGDVKFNMLATDKRQFNYGNITAYLTPLRGKSILRIDPSDVKLANNNWHFNEGNKIQIEGKRITTNDLTFSSADQTVYISSYLKNDTSTSIKLTLDNTSISDFTGIFTTKMRQLHGNINGKLTVEDVFYKPKVFADLVVDEFKLGNELIGDVNVETTLNDAAKRIDIYASVKSINNNLEAKGYLSIDPLHPDLNIEVDGKRVGINFLNYEFFDKYVKNCRGHAVIHATVYGNPKKPLLKGDVLLVDDTVTVSFLNTTYHLSNQKALLDEHGFNFGNHLEVHDEKNNTLIASGRINHESFRQFELDLTANAYNAQFLNTTEKQSPFFYGVGYGDGNVTFKGPISTPKIEAYAKTAPGTWCHLPITTSYETNKYSFYHFVDKDSLVRQTLVNNIKIKGVDFILKLDITPDARMDIILDPVSGDLLTSYGSGNLKIEIPQTGGISIYGVYEIDHGNYLFTLQSVVNKRFEISKGGTISFTGPVYKAALNVDAVYQLRSSVTDLLSNLISSGTDNSGNGSQSQLASAAQSRIPIQLLLKLSGVLEKPNVSFDIKAIDPDPSIKSYVEQQLALLKNNESELNKQVFGLLVMNRFLPQSTTTSGAIVNSSYLGGTATNTVSEFLSSQLSNYISNLLDYAQVKNLDFNIRYRQYDQATTQADPTSNQPIFDTRRELQLALEQRLLNNRLIINAGGNLDFGNNTITENGNNTQSGAKAVIPTGDFQIEYLLTPDGTWRAKAFNRTNYDYFNSRNNNKTGIGISYRKDFDKAADLFHINRKKPKKSKKPVSAKDEKSPPQNTAPAPKQE